MTRVKVCGLTRECDVRTAAALGADALGSIAFFPHVIAQTGAYLSSVCGIERGAPLAYLIAPPLEGVMALDAALKAADVRMVNYTAPPSETNYMGVMLTGDQSACKAAALAFQDMVLEVAERPISF